MPRLDEVELVITNNLARARARVSNSSYNDMTDDAGNQAQASVEHEAAEDDHLLSPRKAKRG